MQLKSKTLQYYEWKDIEKALCRHMGIAENYFRDSHLVVHKDYETLPISNRPYYDFWHVWLELWGETLHNDSYVTVYYPHTLDDESWQRLTEIVTKKYGEWATKLIDATRALCIEQNWGTDPNDDPDPVIVWFSW